MSAGVWANVAGGLARGIAEGYLTGQERAFREKQRRVATTLETLGGMVSSPDIRPEARESLLGMYMEYLGAKDEKAQEKVLQKFPEIVQQAARGGVPEEAAKGPQMTMSGGVPQMGGVPAPPAPGIFVSQAERTGQAAKAEHARASARTQGEIAGRSQALRNIEGFDQLTPAQQASLLSGQNITFQRPMQAKTVARADKPLEPVLANFDPGSGQYIDAQTGQPIPDAVPYIKPPKQTKMELAVDELTAQGMSVVEAVQQVNTRHSESTGIMLVPQPDGSLRAMEYTRKTRSGPALGPVPSPPGTAPSRTTQPAPARGTPAPREGAIRPGQTVGGKDTPEVVAAKKMLGEERVAQATITTVLRDLERNLNEYERAWGSGDPVAITRNFFKLRGVFGPAPLKLGEAYGQTGRALSDRDREAVEQALSPVQGWLGEAVKAVAPGTVRTVLENTKRTLKDIGAARMNALKVEASRGPGAMPAAPAETLPEAAAAQLREGEETTFANGQVWTLRNGVPVKVR